MPISFIFKQLRFNISKFLAIFYILLSTPFSGFANLAGYQAKETFFNQEEACKLSYDHFFNSSIFDAYFNQLKAFISKELTASSWIGDLRDEDPFGAKVHNFISILQTSAQNPADKRQIHERLISLLREMIQIRQEALASGEIAIQQAVQFIDRVCLWMYTSPNLMPSFLEFLQNTDYQSFNINEMENKPFTDLIWGIYQSFKSNPNFAGHLDLNASYHDSHYEGFLITKVYRAFDVQFILTPRITIENESKKTVKIAPEFLNYLRALKSQGKTHLYVNLMNRTEKERESCLAIEKLAKHEEFKDTLIVMTLDKNSDFYWQKGSFPSKSRRFKKILLAELFNSSDKNSAFKWPKSLKRNLWRQSCQEILNTIHAEYFDNKKDLSKEERQNFIEITHVKLIEAMCAEYKPNYANISCKYSMDRGPSLLSLFYVYQKATQGSYTDKDKLHTLTLLFASPILSHNRPPHEMRLQRFNSAFKVITK